jgi:3D (Asp-Asp-Asp) domain-containing protein
MRVNGLILLAAAMMAIPAYAGRSDDAERTVTRVETKKIPRKVVYEVSRTIGRGRIVKAKNGRDGEIKRTYEVSLVNGKPVSKEQISKTYIAPEPTLFYIGKSGYANVSRHKFGRGRVLTMRASAYDPSPRTIPGTTGRTAMGLRAGYGHVAVDPRVIKLGTMVYVEGYGLAIASDTGGAIKGNRIDLCYKYRSEALRFGRRTVRVHILSKA